MQPAAHRYTLLKKVSEAKDVISFYFDRSKDSFDFIPGQYMRVTLQQVTGDQRGNSRMFSISSSPTQNDIFVHTTKISRSIFKQTLAGLKEGDKVDFFGPLGNFVIRKTDPRHHVLLAGGIGLTPFHSMVKYAYDKKLETRITLIVSFSTREDCIFFEELTKISGDSDFINIVYSISDKDNVPQDWKGGTGRINKMMIKKYVPKLFSTSYYICGSEKVISALEELLVAMNIAKENMQKEQFPGY